MNHAICSCCPCLMPHKPCAKHDMAMEAWDDGDDERIAGAHLNSEGCLARCIGNPIAPTDAAPASTDRAPSVYPEEP